MWSFYQILAGACELQEPSGTLALRGGEGVLVPPGVAHQQRWTPAAGGFRQTIIDFELQPPPGHPDPLAGLTRCKAAPLAGPAESERLIADLCLALDESAGRLEARRLRVRGLVEAAILDHLASAFASGAYELGPPTPAWLRDLLRDLSKLMLDPACDLAMIARRAGRSSSYVQRSFRRHLHTTPLRWLNDQRVELAARLLLVEPDHPIVDLARTCGFTDPATFGRNFRRRLGESPRAFRARQRPGESER